MKASFEAITGQPADERSASTVVRVLRTTAELESIRGYWESWPGNRDSEMGSYQAFIRSNRSTIRPHVVVVERHGRPDAIFVGRIDRDPIHCRLGYLRVNLPAKVLVFVYGAFRGHSCSKNQELIVRSVWDSLARGEVDAAYMNFLRADSKLCQFARSVPGALSHDYLCPTQRHFAARLPNSIGEFHQQLSPKVRKNQRWQAKKLEELFKGDVRIRCFRDPSEVDELTCEAERLASRSYQRGLGVGFFGTVSACEHLRLKAEKQWLRGYVLYLGGEPCAFWMGDVNQGTFGSDYLAFDPAYARHSPGMYLIVRVIESFCDGNREGITAIDFGPGHAQYKETLSTEEWMETAVYMFAPTAKGVALNLARTVIGRLDRTAKSLLARAGLLQKVKKAWRVRTTAESN